MSEQSELSRLRQELGEERQRREKAEQQRQQEQRRAEETERRAEETERRAEETERRAEEAEQQRQQEQRRAEEAERRAEEAEQQRQRTTLPEYIEACHNLLFEHFEVETNKSLTSKGSVNKPEKKWCPTRLSPWSDFLEQQKAILGRLYSVYPGQDRVFESLDFLRGLGNRVARKKVANERHLEYIQHTILEEPIAFIIERLLAENRVRDEFGIIGSGIVFDNHPNALSDIADEAAERRAARQPRPCTPERAGPDLFQLRADQICVYKYGEDDLDLRKLAFIVEYKAPHKLTLPHLRLGLREVNVYQDVVNRATKPVPKYTELLFQYYADRLSAAAVTQTFHYMIEGGLEHSYLTTGEAIVFLKIDWADPTTLYYHMAEPSEEVRAHRDNFRHCTAVSQVLAFILLALGSPVHGQSDRTAAMENLHTWDEDPETILHGIPPTDREQTPSPSAFVPRSYNQVDRSPYLFRKLRRRLFEKCQPGLRRADKDPSPQSSDDESQMPETPSRPRDRGESHPTQQHRGDNPQGSSAQGGPSGQYCTQKCLLGLTSRGRLDERCPNINLHRAAHDSQYHPVDHVTWLQLLREQLNRTLDDGVEPLYKQGARGALFRITLHAYGYTIIAKGTVPEFVEDLRHEAFVYQRLRPLHGICVPVFLGAINLQRPYYYDFRVRLVHMIFLSWGGVPVDCGVDKDVQLGRELVRSVCTIHRLGVLHGDMRKANTLWNDEKGRVMLIDFERAVVADPPRAPLSPIGPNKKARPWTKEDCDEDWGQFDCGPVQSNQSAMGTERLIAARILP